MYEHKIKSFPWHGEIIKFKYTGDLAETNSNRHRKVLKRLTNLARSQHATATTMVTFDQRLRVSN